MGLIVVPSWDLSISAGVASSVGLLDYGFLQAGEFLSRSVRIANDSAESVTWHGASSDADGLVQVSPAEGSLAPDEISDTVVITISLPVEAETGSRSIEVTVSADNGDEAVLRLDYHAVGVNVARDSQYPERASSFTDNVSNVVLRAAEPLRLLTFEPVPFSPGDNRVILDFGQTRHLDEGGDHRFLAQSVEERLNPLNQTWGYVRSESVIVGSFQAEMNEITAEFEGMDSRTDYMATARLYVGAEFEFPRTWGLFSVGRSPDTDQYKRTVYLVERRGEFWALHGIVTKFRGNEIAYSAADLVQIEPRNMGSADQYNPFAWTYRAESDKPYAMFTVPTPDLRTIITDGSGSGAPNPSAELNPSTVPVEEPPCPVCPECPEMPELPTGGSGSGSQWYYVDTSSYFGELSADTDIASDITEIVVNSGDDLHNDQTLMLDAMGVGDTLVLRYHGDEPKLVWGVYTVTDVTHGFYHTFTVTPVSGNGSFTTNDPVYFGALD